ncbi:MAG TPA: GNAT family N-acetyltransferase [Terriglobales bacterium]|nr:GNAT family N-acetyltransferase [Terriglobales bacterium]
MPLVCAARIRNYYGRHNESVNAVLGAGLYIHGMAAIRECRLDDFPHVIELLHQLWPSIELDVDRLRAAFRRGLQGKAQRYLCAEDDGRVLGFCSLTLKNSLWQQGFLAHIDELVVDESVRGRGIGTELLVAAIEVAKRQNASRIELDSGFHRTSAHRFYEQRGFQNRGYLFSAKLSDFAT